MNKTFARQDAERMMPLLRSIGREIRERTRTLARLEQELAARSEAPLARDRGEHDAETHALESQLSLHRRELRRVEKELARLGCDLDLDHPLRILIPGVGGAWAYEGQLDDTSFRSVRQDSPA